MAAFVDRYWSAGTAAESLYSALGNRPFTRRRTSTRSRTLPRNAAAAESEQRSGGRKPASGRCSRLSVQTAVRKLKFPFGRSWTDRCTAAAVLQNTEIDSIPSVS